PRRASHAGRNPAHQGTALHLRHRPRSNLRRVSGLTMSLPSAVGRICVRHTLGAGFALAVLLALSPTAIAAEQFGDLRFATPGPTITTLPMQIVHEKGMDKEQGFTAAITIATGSVGIKAMLAGD